MQGDGDHRLGMARARLRSNMREVGGCWIFGPNRFKGDHNKHRTMMVA